MIEIALYQPDIAPNTATILRLAACLGVRVRIIEPAGFLWSQASFRRAGMDYLAAAEVVRETGFAQFIEHIAGRRLVLFSTRGEAAYGDFAYAPDDVLLFGRESAGVPGAVAARADHRLVIPMRPGLRSLNVALAAAMATGEALRQTGGFGYNPAREREGDGDMNAAPAKLMQGFPPGPDERVTLANWRLPPFSRWAFSRVRELIPTAAIAGAGGTERSCANRDLTGLNIPRPGGGSLGFADWLAETFCDGLAVVKDGELVSALYPGDLEPGQPHIVFSVSKSITAIVAGILTGQGLIDPDWPVTRLIPEAEGSAYGDCTIRHVLDMTVSVVFDEDYLDPQSIFARYREAMMWNLPGPGQEAKPGDLRGFTLSLRKGPRQHGEAFHYVSPNSDLLGWLLERASGRRYADLVADLVWSPMGARHQAYVTLDSLGGARAAGGVCVSLTDLARFGELVLNHGKAGGRQVCPAAWIEDMWTGGDRRAWRGGDMASMFPAGRYRSKWYQTGNDHQSLAAIGIHGQWIWIDPVTGVVIAKLSSQPLPADDTLDHLTIAGLDAIARAV